MRLSKFTGIVFLVTMVTFLRTQQRVDAILYSYEIKAKERQIEKLLDQERDLHYNIARLKAPQYLEGILEENCVKMVMPERWQLIETNRVAKVDVEPRIVQLGRNFAALFTLKSEAQATPAKKMVNKKRK